MVGKIVFIGLLFCIIAISLYLSKNMKSKKLKQLREDWGKIPEDGPDFEAALYHRFSNTLIGNSYGIDNDTWQDLDLDKIYTLINRALTPIGAQYLYKLLRHPLMGSELLNKREILFSHFAKNEKLRESVQLAIYPLKDENSKYLPYFLWKPLPDKPPYAFIFRVLGFIAIIVLILVLLGYLNFIAMIAVFIINLAVRLYIKRKIDIYIHSFQYLGVLIRAADKISTLEFDELGDIQTELKKSLRSTKNIAKDIFALQVKDEFGFFEYLNIYFLWDITGFYAAIDKISKNINSLITLYESVGILDSHISIASFRTQYHDFCRPQFVADYGKYVVKEIHNPLLEKPIANSFEFNLKNIMITGSNMAGKTTFVKTMGVNVVLAQTINTCFASHYQAPFIKVISSIGRTDDLVSGKSYYLAEVESVLRLVNASTDKTVHLFILDEIFRGTNSVERLAASIEVLKYLANGKDYVLVATHDLQLTKILDQEYENYHFRDQVCAEGLDFDYKLHPGPSTTKNAIALLDFVGYPKSIVNRAANRVQTHVVES